MIKISSERLKEQLIDITDFNDYSEISNREELQLVFNSRMK